MKVTNRGFLTMFDDVSGFGAWHRRWFVLEGNTLYFWTYPENEKVQGKIQPHNYHYGNISHFVCLDPIGSIDLGSCVTQEVAIAPREICSRMNTFMLETSRAAQKNDKDSLVIQTKGGYIIYQCVQLTNLFISFSGHVTILRHLLSADSRQERVLWCDILNKALENLRAWDTVTRSGSFIVKKTFQFLISGLVPLTVLTPWTRSVWTPAQLQQTFGDTPY